MREFNADQNKPMRGDGGGGVSREPPTLNEHVIL